MNIKKEYIKITSPIPFLLLVIFICCISYSCSPESAAISIENDKAQLFIDDYLIQSTDNLKRTLNTMVKDDNGNKPVIALENEFEGLGATLQANGTIIYDPRIEKYVMISLAYSSEGRSLKKKPRWTFYRLYRFTSKDGINWIKGDDGIPQWVYPRTAEDLYDPGSGTSATNIDAFSYYYDKSDKEYPYKGWQHFANWGDDREGNYYIYSADGIHWNRGPMVVNGYASEDDLVHRKIHQDGRTLAGPGDVTVFYHDSIKDRFLGIFKFYSPNPVEYGNRLRSRTYAFFSHPLDQPFDINRLEHIELLPPAAEKNNDMPHDEYYGSMGWRYESLWLGGLKIWHGGGDYDWSAAGCAFLKLIVSRDGLNWTKVPFINTDGIPEVIIANGPEGGNNGKNDGGYMTQFTQGPLRIGNELIYYYGCSSYGKNHPDNIRISGGGIFRARLRIDGFVSVDSGSVTTKLLSFEGNHLYLNAIGPITVEVLNSSGKILGTQTVSCDSLKHQVIFDGKNLSDVVEDRKMRLRFNIGEGGKLYSFTIVS
jgi:hypothetical protein